MARECASAVRSALAARAVVIHLHRRGSLEARITAAAGWNGEILVGSSSVVDDDIVLSTVVANDKPMVLRLEGELPQVAPERLWSLGASRSVVALPIQDDPRDVAILEIVDADELRAPTLGAITGTVSDALTSLGLAPLPAS